MCPRKRDRLSRLSPPTTPPGVLTGRLALSVVAPRLTTETIQKAACFVWIQRARSGTTSPGISAHAFAAEAPRGSSLGARSDSKETMSRKVETKPVISFSGPANRLVPHRLHSVTLSTPLFGSTGASCRVSPLLTLQLGLIVSRLAHTFTG